MNKKVLSIILAIVIVLGGGYWFYTSNEEAKKQQGDIEITHDLGTVSVTQNPATIVAFDFGALDILDSLDVKVTGVVQKGLPEYLKKYESSEYQNVGTLFEPNYETLAAMKPDVIFISGRQSAAYEELSKIAPTIFISLDTKNYMESLTHNVTMIADIVNKEKEATKQLAQLEKDVTALHDKAAAAEGKALVLLTNQGSISAFGPGSRFGMIYSAFGVKPADEGIAESTHGQTVSYEYIAEKNPDYMFVVDRNQVVGGEDGSKAFENDLMKNVTAYKNGKIIMLNVDAWYLSSGGLQSTETMIADINSAFTQAA